MKIYSTEKLDGIAEAIIASASAGVKLTCQIVDNVDYHGDDRVLASLPDHPDQKDLYHLNAILASTGWNKNDDVFLPEHLWAAKDTPVNKQLNMMHDDNDIMGHMTGSVAVDFNGNIIQDMIDQFDVAVSAVIYKFRSDNEVRAFVANLIEEIEQGRWAVSMECLFADFDYSISKADGSHHTLTRDESTAFLTKHLRSYGGTGKYQDYTIGRVLKDITFSGVGIVDNPAGPRSEILKRDTNPFLDVTPITVAALNTVAHDVYNSDKENDMTIEQLQAQVAQLTKDLEAAKSQAAKAQEVADAAKAEAVAKKEAELVAAADEAKANVAVKDEIITALKADIAQAEEARDEAIEARKAVEAALETEKSKAKTAERRAQLVEAGVKDGDITVKLEKFGSASDEVFASVIDLLKETAAKNPFVKDKKDDEEDAKAEDESAEAEADTDIDLETAEAGLNVVEDDEQDAKAALRAELAQFAKAALTLKK